MNVTLTRRPVRLSFASDATADSDEACRLVGRFRRAARAQGWTETEVERACQGITVKHVASHLTPYIEPTAPEPLSWRTQFDRTRDYVAGCRVLAHDPAADFDPFRWLARGFAEARRRGTP